VWQQKKKKKKKGENMFNQNKDQLERALTAVSWCYIIMNSILLPGAIL